MEGYDVLTYDGHKFGRVVRAEGDTLVVEHGALLKYRIGLPRELADVDAERRVVHTTVSKRLLEEAPRVKNGDVDEDAVAAYYGLARGYEAPSTAGYGDVLPDETGRSAEDDAHRLGVRTGEEERAAVRTGADPGEGRLDRDVSTGLTGGDRYRDAPTRED
jgi:hypothetical protein